MTFFWKSCIQLRIDRALCNSNPIRDFPIVNLYKSTRIVANEGKRSVWSRPKPHEVRWSNSTEIPIPCSLSRQSFNLNIGTATKSYENLRRIFSVSNQVQENIGEDDSARRICTHLQNLKHDVQRRNSPSRVEIEKILHLMQICESKDYLVDGLDPGLLLLQSCGNLMPNQLPAVRVELAHQVVNIMQKTGLTMATHHYNALLKCYIENKHATSMAEFLKNMHAIPNEQTYHLLLWCACETGDLEQAGDVISQMKEKGFPASEPVFNALVYGHAQTGDFASAHSVFETMRSAQVMPSSDTYTALLRGLAVAGNAGQMQKIFQEAALYKIALSENQIFDIIKAISISGHSNSLPMVMKWLPELDVEGGDKLRSLLIHLVHLQITDAVMLLVKKLSTDDSTPFGRFLVRESVQAKWSVTSILALCDLLSEHNPLALTQATEAVLRTADVELAVQLLQAMKRSQAAVRPHYFWPLLLSEGRTRGEEGVFAVLHHMQEMKVPVDSTTLSFYVLPYVSQGAPSVLVRRLQDSGLALSEVLSPVVAALISDGRMKASLALCGEFNSQLNCELLLLPLVRALLSGADIRVVVDFLKLFTSSSKKATKDWTGHFLIELLANKRVAIEAKQLDSIIKILCDAGLHCSQHAADIVAQQISAYSGQLKNSEEILETLNRMIDLSLSSPSNEGFNQQMVHPRDMTLEELECQLVELQAKGMNTRGILRRLLQMYCRLGNADKALEVKLELEKANHEFTPGMQAALFDLFLQRGQLDQAEECFSDLARESPSFVLDEHKIIDFATLLMTNKKYEMALSVLENRSPVKGGASVSRNCWKLLHTTAERGDPEIALKMLHTLVKFGYCTISNVLLGPIIRAYFFQNNLEGAVKEFESCVTKYKKTPLLHELLCRLISASDKSTSDGLVPPDRAAQLMQEVMTSVQAVHGAASVLVTFAVALSEMGKTKQLARLLRESPTKINISLLLKRCKRIADEDKLDALQNLVTAFRGLKSFDLAPFFTLILQIYCRRGNSQAALQLWSSIQEMDCEPSSKFLIMLADLLESHKIEVPFSVPQPEVELSLLRKPLQNRLDRLL